MAAQVRCASCGAINVEDARFCTNCGRPVGGDAATRGITPDAEWVQSAAQPPMSPAHRASAGPAVGARWQPRAEARNYLPIAAGVLIGVGLLYAMIGLGLAAGGSTLGSALAFTTSSSSDGFAAAALSGVGTAVLAFGAAILILGLLLVARPRPWVRVAAIATATVIVLSHVFSVVGFIVGIVSGGDLLTGLIQILVALALAGLFAWVIAILVRSPADATSVSA